VLNDDGDDHEALNESKFKNVCPNRDRGICGNKLFQESSAEMMSNSAEKVIGQGIYLGGCFL
jgi:hypothetical protein